MTKNRKGEKRPLIGPVKSPPNLSINKLGIVSRDYRHTYANGYRDFSHALPQALKLLDEDGCDAALFSLYGIIPRKPYAPLDAFRKLSNIRAVFLEEFLDGSQRKAGRYVIYHRASREWEEYSFSQVFGTLSGMPRNEMEDFVETEMPKRILGNCCVLLCGETNGVKYSRENKRVEDTFGLRRAIPKEAKIVLNPIHDRMTRFEMKLKRRFLSQCDRWVISVWNKGKADKNGKVKDGKNPPWTVFHNGKDVSNKVDMIGNQFDLDIGVLNIKQP